MQQSNGSDEIGEFADSLTPVTRTVIENKLPREAIQIALNSGEIAFVIGAGDHHEMAGIGIGQRAEKDLIHDAEDGRVCSDAQSEREENAFAKLASGVAKISTNLFDPLASRKRFPSVGASLFNGGVIL